MSRHLPYDRAERVGDEIFKLISEALCTELSDPRLKNIHITRVRMTKDLKVARVYFYFTDKSLPFDEKEVIKGLTSAKGFLKRLVADGLSIRYTPEMAFYYDDVVDLRDKIDSLSAGGAPND
jgi:ribosome-binding factor A